MRLPLTIRINGGAAVSRAGVEQLEPTARSSGWERQDFAAPGVIVFEARPPRPMTGEPVGVWVDPDTQELVIGSCEDDGARALRPSGPADLAVNAFLCDVIVPIAEAVGSELAILHEGGLDALVPGAVAEALGDLTSQGPPRRGCAPARSKGLERLVAIAHVSGAALDGAALAGWLEGDLRWPSEVAVAFGCWFDEGLAFLRAHEREGARPDEEVLQ